jgi:hypothetical protein
MNSRALLLIAAFVTSPAWAQQPSFDPHSAAVKTILRATAATQFATSTPVEGVEPKDPESPAELEIAEVPLIAEQAPTDAGPTPPAPKRRKHTFLSAMIDTLVESSLDNWLGTGDADDTLEWTSCRKVDSKVVALQYEVSPECLRSASYLP